MKHCAKCNKPIKTTDRICSPCRRRSHNGRPSSEYLPKVAKKLRGRHGIMIAPRTIDDTNIADELWHERKK